MTLFLTFSLSSLFFFKKKGMDLNDFDTVYMKAVLHLWNLAKTANDVGDFFPIWGTCLGFETICVAAANDPAVLINVRVCSSEHSIGMIGKPRT